MRLWIVAIFIIVIFCFLCLCPVPFTDIARWESKSTCFINILLILWPSIKITFVPKLSSFTNIWKSLFGWLSDMTHHRIKAGSVPTELTDSSTSGVNLSKSSPGSKSLQLLSLLLSLQRHFSRFFLDAKFALSLRNFGLVGGKLFLAHLITECDQLRSGVVVAS